MRTHGAHPHRRAGRVGLLGHRGDAHPGPAPQSGAAGGGERPLAGRDGREARGCPRPGRPAAVRAPGAGRRAGPRMCRRAPLHSGRRLAPTGPSAAGGEREAIGRARLVANPGCYPTAAALALVPLLRAGVLAPGEAIVDAASGTTGAGRKATEEMSFTEVMDDFRAYRVLRHQHTPEIAQALSRAAGRDVPLTFTAHLLPLRRGILATCYARLAEGRTGRDAAGALSHIYATEPFLDLAAGPDEVSLKAVVGTNRCQIGLAADAGRIVVISAIDNLVKGAAGQAVQNLNLALGWPETSGLDTLRGFNP